MMFSALHRNTIIAAVMFMTFTALGANAQSETINSVRAAMKTGSSRELINYFNEMVELSFEGEKSSYSKTQAEFVLKDFFKKFPPEDFQYIHQGASKEGLRYAIGRYSSASGTFRVYMLVKQFNKTYLVDTIDFSRD